MMGKAYHLYPHDCEIYVKGARTETADQRDIEQQQGEGEVEKMFRVRRTGSDRR